MKNRFIQYLLLAVAIISFLSSCDQINRPYEEKSGPIDVDTTKKKILIEDITGHFCGNCPEARDVAEHLADTYSNVIAISVHEGPLAKALPGLFKYNWMIPEATSLATRFNLVATPFGLVNRVKFNGKNLISPDAWEAAVKAELNVTADLGLKLTPTYNSTTREISLNSEIKYIKDGNADQYLMIYIIEDSIVKPQKNDFLKPFPYDTFYVHKNVLRASMNGINGEQISDVVIKAGTKTNKIVKYTIPTTKDWRIEKLSLVAIIRNNITEEILQVEKINLK